MKKRRELLRDPNNPEEKDLRYEIEEFRTRMYSAWLFEGKWRPDFKDIASEARLHPKTVEKFVLGATQHPHIDTVIRLASALGYRVTLVTRNAPHQPEELRKRKDAGEHIRKALTQK